MLITNDKKEKEVTLSLFVVYSLLTCVIYVLPAMNLLLPYILVALLMLVSLPVILLKDPYCVKYGLVIICATLFMFFSNFIIGGFTIVEITNEAIRNIRFFIPALWGTYAIRFCNNKQHKLIIIVLLIIIAFITINTLAALEKEPLIARVLAQDKSTTSDEVDAYRLRNVGGYSFSYMMGIVTIIFEYLSFEFKKTFAKILCVVATIVCFYYIIQTMYTTLLLLCSISVIIIMFFRIKNPGLRGVVAIALIGVLFLLPQIFGFLSDTFPSDSLLSTKFEQMQMTMSGEGVDALGRRPELLAKAIENWKMHPVFGSRCENSSHSLIFGFLQQNGLIGLCVWFVAFISSWKVLYTVLKENGIKTMLFNIVMFYLLTLSVFNDTGYTFEIAIATFFIVPVVSVCFLGEKSSDKKMVFDKSIVNINLEGEAL